MHRYDVRRTNVVLGHTFAANTKLECGFELGEARLDTAVAEFGDVGLSFLPFRVENRARA